MTKTSDSDLGPTSSHPVPAEVRSPTADLVPPRPIPYGDGDEVTVRAEHEKTNDLVPTIGTNSQEQT